MTIAVRAGRILNIGHRSVVLLILPLKEILVVGLMADLSVDVAQKRRWS